MSIFRSIISPMQNCDEVAVRFCKQLGVRATETSIKKEIVEHPNYPSLLSVSDTLRSFNVGNVSLKTVTSNFSSFPTPFIAQVHGQTSQYTLFATVNKILPNDTINWYNPEKKKNGEISIKDFEAIFTGCVMLAEINETSGEANYKENKKEEIQRNFWNATIALAFPVLLLLLSAYTISTVGLSNSILPILFALVTLIGTITGALLLLYEIDQFNPVIQKVCRGGRKTNCGAILKSNASHVMGISWSAIGFTYFCGVLMAVILTGLVNYYMLSVLAIFSLLALPYIFFSIYYQAKVAGQWCPMCLIAQIVLALQFIIAFKGDFFRILSADSLPYLFILFASFIIVFISVQLLVPALQESKEKKYIQHELARLKHDPKIFRALLEKQKKITHPTAGLGIVLGDRNATIKLTKVCNPYCRPCAMAHPIIDDLLENNPNIRLQIIFTALGDKDDYQTPPVQHLLVIAEKGNETLTKQALSDWYLMKEKDYDQFALKYPMNEDLQSQIEKIRAMHQWNVNERTEFTPTFFINDYQLPEIYNVSDLKYFLSV